MLEAIASDVVDNYGNGYQLNLVLDDAVKNNTAPAVEALLFWRYADEVTAAPKPLGVATVGQSFTFPIEFADGRQVEIFAVGKTASGEQAAVNPLNGETYRFTPNRETGTPNFSQDGIAQNLQVNFIATGFSAAKFRKIQYATDSGFTTGLVEKTEGNLNSTLSANFNITRPSGSGTLAVYVRIAHSTNNQTFGEWSETRQATFADSGGSGGSSGGAPPLGLDYYLDGNTANIFWTDGAGTNKLYRNINGGGFTDVGSYSGSTTDTLSEFGYYRYYVANDDGATNEISFYYYG